MMVAEFYDEEQVKQVINLENGLVRQVLWAVVNYSAVGNFRQTPDDWFGGGCINEFNQRLDFGWR